MGRLPDPARRISFLTEDNKENKGSLSSELNGVFAVLRSLLFKDPSVCIRIIHDIRAVPNLPNFPRNEPPNPTEYFGERPEMSSLRREVREGQNKKRELER